MENCNVIWFFLDPGVDVLTAIASKWRSKWLHSIASLLIDQVHFFFYKSMMWKIVNDLKN